MFRIKITLQEKVLFNKSYTYPGRHLTYLKAKMDIIPTFEALITSAYAVLKVGECF